MSTLTLIPNVTNAYPHKSMSFREMYRTAAGRLNMSGRQLHYLLLGTGLVSLGTLLLTYPM